MIRFFKSLFGGKKVEPQAEAPYKVEAQPVEVVLTDPPTVVVVEGAGAVDVPAKKPAKSKKPAAMKAKKPANKPKASKKPKQPKQPKAE